MGRKELDACEMLAKWKVCRD